jgi:phosphoribosylanthranilate isomerase
MTAVKVCGLTRPRDAIGCAGLGIRYLGLNFAPQSPRRVDVERAREIVAAVEGDVVWVGVFVNERPARIAEIVREVPLALVQLHGEEPPELAASWGERAWKVLHAGDGDPAAAAEGYPSVGAYLLDGGGAGRARGGTGQSWDFRRARPLAARRQVWIAGGVGPDNVASAILAARPAGVDVNSQVESRPGIKDLERIREVVKEVERADRQIAGSGEDDRA